VTVKLEEVIKLVPNVPDRLIPLVTFVPVIFKASVAVIWLPVAVSLLARDRIEATVASVEEESFCLILMAAAVSVLPAIEVFWVNSISRPMIDPVETAVVPWALVTLNWLALQAVLAAELLVEVKFVRVPVVRPAFVKAKVLPVVAVGLKVKLALPVILESEVK